jgi:DNA-binding transcriptional LysR family regulator
MKSALDWEDIRLFLAVARGEGLSGAARQAGPSPATLGRRMTALEQGLGQRLFIRERLGYRLTVEGRQFLAQAEEMEAAATGIERWRDGLSPRRTVRISAGTWTSWFLARHIDALWSPDEPWSIDFVAANARLDIARGQADIGLRNRRPEEPWLAGRRTGDVAFAAYGRRGAALGDRWIGVTGDGAVTPSARWVAERHAATTVMRGNDPRLILDLLRRGVGRAVLPCFAGDSEPELERLQQVEELRHQQWLVLHNDERRHPAVRTVIERIVRLMRGNRALFQGESPGEDPAG